MPGPADVLAAAGLFGPGSAVDRMLYRGGDVPGASGSAEHSDQVAGLLADPVDMPAGQPVSAGRVQPGVQTGDHAVAAETRGEIRKSATRTNVAVLGRRSNGGRCSRPEAE